jgi:tryptophan-rich sensory protein
LLGFVGLSLLAAVASACVALANARGWVALLVQPPFLPRNPLPAWLLAVLAGAHVALALAAWLVWRQPMAASRQVLAMNHWGWLLALGALWPAAFFGLHQLAPALAVAAGLVACGALTLRRFAELDSAAAVLLIPYCGYTAAALYVSVGFWWLNH